MDELELLLRDWRTSMRARNRSPRTIQSYEESARQLFVHTGASTVVELNRRAVESFLADLAGRMKPATVAVRFRSLQQFFKWLVDEGEMDVSPMAGMSAPTVPVEPVEVLDIEAARKLVATCTGRTFPERRDQALLRLFLDTGARLAEVTQLQVADVDLDDNVIVVVGKGRRPRSAPFGDKTAQALSRYLRARLKHPRVHLDALWLGEGNRGAMTESGITQVIRRRGRQAGIEGLHPHQFRHTFAAQWLAAGGTEGDLMKLAGWQRREMLDRYGSAVAVERAKEAHRRLSLGDRL